MQEKVIIIIDDHYFDVTNYLDSHPGGKKFLKKFHLKDASNEFNSIKGHGDEYALSLLDKYCIGHINNINISNYLQK